jgi:hypothetical protein
MAAPKIIFSLELYLEEGKTPLLLPFPQPEGPSVDCRGMY